MPTTGPALPGARVTLLECYHQTEGYSPLNPGPQIHGWQRQVFCQVQMTYVPPLSCWLGIHPVKGTKEVDSLCLEISCLPSYMGTRKEQDSWSQEQPGELGRAEGLWDMLYGVEFTVPTGFPALLVKGHLKPSGGTIIRATTGLPISLWAVYSKLNYSEALRRKASRPLYSAWMS